MADRGNVNLYRRAARQRLEDARYLLASDDPARGTGAVYLAGYAVECGLKALHLSRFPKGAQQRSAMKDYRTAKSHGYDWLRRRIVATPGGDPFTEEALTLLADLGGWGTRLRYDPASTPKTDAEAFVSTADRFLTWIEEKTL